MNKHIGAGVECHFSISSTLGSEREDKIVLISMEMKQYPLRDLEWLLGGLCRRSLGGVCFLYSLYLTLLLIFKTPSVLTETSLLVPCWDLIDLNQYHEHVISTNKASSSEDPSRLQSPFNSRYELFAPCHVLFSPESRTYTRIESLDLEFLNSDSPIVNLISFGTEGKIVMSQYLQVMNSQQGVIVVPMQDGPVGFHQSFLESAFDGDQSRSLHRIRHVPARQEWNHLASESL
ncbi:hypothetical protein Tco_0185340 [Tanacetum coccineum]